MMQTVTLWQAVLGELEMQLPRPTFETWLQETWLRRREETLYVIGVPTPATREWLEQNLASIVAGAIARVTGGPARLRFVVDAIPSPARQPAGLAPDHTFDSFLYGPENEAVTAAARAAARQSGTPRPPLFIYGAAGLGKSHLLHAVGNAARAAGHTVLYTTPRRFTAQLIQAVRRRTVTSFRAALMAVDLFLLDDAQLLAGRDRAQAELLRILPALQRHCGQIVIAADRRADAIGGVDEGLRAWFAAADVHELHQPQFETRAAILRAMARRIQIPIPDEVLTFVARATDDNVRELAGALNRVLAGAAVGEATVDLGLARQTLTDEIPRERVLTVGDVITAVARHYGLSVTALCGSGRARTISLPRQVCMYLARTETSASLPEIGAKLGNRDHTTVLYGYEKIAGAIRENEQLRQVTITIRTSLRNQS